MFVRSGFPFNYDTDDASEESGLECKDVSLTLQSQAEEADINTIVKRFHLTGQLPVGVRAPLYGDFTGIFDYQSAMNVIRQANESFLQMPADVRSRFGNDAQQFLEFTSAQDAEGKFINAEEMKKLGLVVPAVPAEVGLADVVAAVQAGPVAVVKP